MTGNRFSGLMPRIILMGRSIAASSLPAGPAPSTSVALALSLLLSLSALCLCIPVSHLRLLSVASWSSTENMSGPPPKKRKTEHNVPAQEHKPQDQTQWLEGLLQRQDLARLDQLPDPPSPGTQQQYMACFEKMAKGLLTGTVMMINGTAHRLAEIEFYYNGGHHQDPFAHCDPVQQEFGRWYFHRAGTGPKAAYKGGSYKGLDISFGGAESGNGQHRAFGGVLVRSICPLSEGKQGLVEGPCKVVEHILHLCKEPDIASLVKHAGPDAAPSLLPSNVLNSSADCPLYLAPAKAGMLSSVVVVPPGPRFGLTLKRVRPGVESYVMRLYRYVSCEPVCFKKGKANLLLGLYASGLQNEEALAKQTGTPLGTVKKYLSALRKAQAKEPAAFHGASLGNEQLCQLFGACVGAGHITLTEEAKA
eukprot:g19022.t1